jgi:hypothetical protein
MPTYFDTQPSQEQIMERMKGYGSWLEIDLDNLRHNLSEIKRHTGTEVMAVVKNNADGHGLVPVTAYLELQGVKWCIWWLSSTRR